MNIRFWKKSPAAPKRVVAPHQWSTKPFMHPVRLIQATVLLVILGYAALLVHVIYVHVYSSVLLPRTIDPSQVTAQQEKVDRTLLESVLEADEEKRSSSGALIPRTPF